VLINEVNRYICKEAIEHERTKPPRDGGIYWPSQASAVLANGGVVGQCLRASFYNIKRTPQTNPPSIEALRKMAFGIKIEEFELQKAKASGVLIAPHITFELLIGSIAIRGNIDGIGKKDDHLRGMEYKTGSGYYFTKEVWGTPWEPGSPRFSNLLQVMLYLEGFREHKEYAFDTCALIYIDRGTGATNEYTVRLDAGYPVIDEKPEYVVNIKSVYDRFKLLDRYITRNILPPSDFRNTYSLEEVRQLYTQKKISKKQFEGFIQMGSGCDADCSWCNWYNQCKRDS